MFPEWVALVVVVEFRQVKGLKGERALQHMNQRNVGPLQIVITDWLGIYNRNFV